MPKNYNSRQVARPTLLRMPLVLGGSMARQKGWSLNDARTWKEEREVCRGRKTRPSVTALLVLVVSEVSIWLTREVWEGEERMGGEELVQIDPPMFTCSQAGLPAGNFKGKCWVRLVPASGAARERRKALRKGKPATPLPRWRAPGRSGAGRSGAAHNRCGSGPTLPERAAGPRAGSPWHGGAPARAPLLVGVWEAGRSGRGRAQLVAAPPPPALPPPGPCGPGSHFGKSFVMVVG